MTKHTPATPLLIPENERVAGYGYRYQQIGGRTYDIISAHKEWIDDLVRRDEAYPRLVEALLRAQPWIQTTSNGKPMAHPSQIEAANVVESLLRELGEL